MSTTPSPTPAAGTAVTNTPGAPPVPGVEPQPVGTSAQGSGAPAAGAGEAVAAPKPPAADPKGARLLLKEQEATRKLNAERVALQAEREKIAADQATARAAMEAEFKANPMAFAKKYGVSYEDITKAAIADSEADTPAARIARLENERKQEREAAETARKAAELRQQQEQAQRNVAAYVDGIHGAATKEAAKYACVNALDPTYAKGLIYDVADLMTRERQEAGNRALPTAAEVLDKMESYLDGEADRLGKARAAKAAKAAAAAGAGDGAAGGNGAVTSDGENAAVAEMIAAQKASAIARGRPAPKNLTNQNTQAPTPARSNGKMTRDDAIKAAIAAGLAAAKG